MKKGEFIPPSLPFGGYCNQNGTVEICEPEAQIVRKIFCANLDGNSTHDIAQRLSQAGVASKLGSTKWTPGAVRYILGNKKYVGDSLWQKTYMTESFPYHHQRNFGEKEAYFVTDTHQTIVDRVTFDAVKELLKKRKLRYSKVGDTDTPHKRHLLGY